MSEHRGLGLAGLAMMVPLVVLSGCLITKKISQSMHFETYLTQAAHANTLDMADDMLARAMVYADDHGWREGNTAILFPTAQTDIAVWRKNMDDGRAEIAKARAEGTSLAASNTLMKLRESIELGAPAGLVVFPNNGMWAAGFGLFGLLAAGGAACCLVRLGELA